MNELIKTMYLSESGKWKYRALNELHEYLKQESLLTDLGRTVKSFLDKYRQWQNNV